MRRLLGLLLACAFALAQAQEIARADLPPEGRETLALIARGGPFPYPRDGIEFRNYEKLLPVRPRGHYREYTVATPGLKHRGARRIVCGGEVPARPAACWYTADHYRSFERILP
ncbi:MAG: ribonuclease domain-containing protein [Pseudomonadota bacterium]